MASAEGALTGPDRPGGRFNRGPVTRCQRPTVTVGEILNGAQARPLSPSIVLRPFPHRILIKPARNDLVSMRKPSLCLLSPPDTDGQGFESLHFGIFKGFRIADVVEYHVERVVAQKISSPITKVGTPKTPRPIAHSVFARSFCLTAGSLSACSGFAILSFCARSAMTARSDTSRPCRNTASKTVSTAR